MQKPPNPQSFFKLSKPASSKMIQFILVLMIVSLIRSAGQHKHKVPKDKITCGQIEKYTREFDSLPELEFLGSRTFCQVVLSDCDSVFEKSRYEEISLYAFTSCAKVQLDFSLQNSFTGDVFMAIVPSIDSYDDYVIRFISHHNYEEMKDREIEKIISREEFSRLEMFEKIKETRQLLFV